MPGRIQAWIQRQVGVGNPSYLYALLGESTLGLTFLLHIVLARLLGPDQFGLFSAAGALAGILAVFIQFGLPVLLHRDVAADPAEGSRRARLYMVIQSLHVLPTLLFLPLILNALGFVAEGRVVCYLMVLAEFGRSVKMTWRSVMKGHEWFKMEAVAVAIERLAVAVCVGVVLVWTGNLVAVVATMALARLVDNLGVGVYLGRIVRLGAPLRRAAVGDTYRRVYPFALHGLLWILYYQVDVVMLKALTTQTEVGFYSAAYRFLEIVSALSRVVFFVAFTHFARAYALDPARLPAKLFAEFRVLARLVLPGLVLAGYAQAWLVRAVYGEAYTAAIVLLAVLLPSLAVRLFSALAEEYLLATGKERALPPLLFVVAAGNVAANFVLIPRYGALGAAIATGLSECLYCLLSFRLLIRHATGMVGVRILRLLPACVALCAAPSLMALGVSPAISVVVALGVGLGLIRSLRAPRSMPPGET